jgi:hypothetical protein
MNSMSMFTTRGSHSVTPWGRVETSAGAEDVRRTTARWTTDGSRKSERRRRTTEANATTGGEGAPWTEGR